MIDIGQGFEEEVEGVFGYEFVLKVENIAMVSIEKRVCFFGHFGDSFHGVSVFDFVGALEVKGFLITDKQSEYSHKGYTGSQ